MYMYCRPTCIHVHPPHVCTVLKSPNIVVDPMNYHAAVPTRNVSHKNSYSLLLMGRFIYIAYITTHSGTHINTCISIISIYVYVSYYVYIACVIHCFVYCNIFLSLSPLSSLFLLYWFESGSVNRTDQLCCTGSYVTRGHYQLLKLPLTRHHLVSGITRGEEEEEEVEEEEEEE